jgi:hypothetical protein
VSARDDIAALLFTTDNSKAVAPWSEWEHSKNEPRLTEYVYAMADALLAAGYSKPRTITTTQDLESLNQGAVVLDSDEWVLRKTRLSWQAVASSGLYSHDAVGLPATVLHEGALA